jgi:hypothetical protein
MVSPKLSGCACHWKRLKARFTYGPAEKVRGRSVEVKPGGGGEVKEVSWNGNHLREREFARQKRIRPPGSLESTRYIMGACWLHMPSVPAARSSLPSEDGC